ncbi:pseudouridine synthase Rsu [Alkalidesulfovibrio alkalitolerans DSM 16529]|uniref:Pseudouridine synthase n=1 Tax=Alkalidesulfovibrio alkalitolerans DSM 16529 TaxID=1121439 RepID=S7UDW0_9BACT|nr:pseudouridine synthase [Alkalidesulfovibrio alkalitolerans]EPR30398.1 pseudouridine synthase Rsu [Alkalidesulfovibrio alkalitolerans DSM 16529]
MPAPREPAKRGRAADNEDGSTALRLNKALAQAGVCSRRAADDLIFAGRVTVNGETVTEPGRRVDPGTDRVAVDGRPLAAPPPRHVYVLLHKPVGVVTTLSDPEGRPTVLALLPASMRKRRIVPVGRLDVMSEGLLLLTDDGELVNRMTHPRHHVPKTYALTVRGAVDEAALGTMRRGMRLAEGEKLAPVEARIVGRTRESTLLELVLRQGVNRQIRRMCRDLGLTVQKLKRTAIGPLALGDLGPGKARELTRGEIGRLRSALGLTA